MEKGMESHGISKTQKSTNPGLGDMAVCMHKVLAIPPSIFLQARKSKEYLLAGYGHTASFVV